MKLSDFYYTIPENLIAQVPIEKRDSSRLMVLNNGNIEHRIFSDILDYINPGDCLVLNNSKVIPARLFGKREDKNISVEFVLLKNVGEKTWETIVRPGKHAKVQHTFNFSKEVKAKIIEVKEDGNRIVEFYYNGAFESVLDKIGQMPLPPYIKTKLEDSSRYQTVYAKFDGSAAAPTAGLHFTRELLDKLRAKGVDIAYVTLHVGLGTFRPVKVQNISEHKMHSESFEITEESCEKILKAKKDGKRVIAVGTTSCRVLESLNGDLTPQSGETDIFIYPGYKFRVVDALITNFHLPESTLLMLVCAFSGKENMLKAYEVAIEHGYRFFSFGDAMFVS